MVKRPVQKPQVDVTIHPGVPLKRSKQAMILSKRIKILGVTVKRKPLLSLLSHREILHWDELE